MVDWQQQQVEVYQRQQEQLALLKTCLGEDKLSSPLLPGFECPISRLWMPPLL
ncbi:Uma2 family endonuclease [Synechococcus bigranulatus str. 'Rupite']|uniref:Uma2 family endonuclease n=1 Tax=Thermostichus vulcanus str. 'Rupite' TaxID=2813851 RepID=A0ABT0CDN4_THEVL|nr:Uma2 family endonuclease [Thermostichus vulcanus str. 'Rupite']